MGRNELRVVLLEDERLVRDLLMYKRTEKYIRQNVSVAQQEIVKRILNDKGFQNRERLVEIETRLQQLLGQAKLIINSGDVDVSGDDGQARILRGFHKLIEYSYPNLRMLRGVAYNEGDVGNYLRHSKEGLLGNDATNLTEPEQELLGFIQSNARGGVRTTLKNLLERFERKPYGWYYAAILCNVALLCARGKLEVRSDSNVLEDDALERALRNTHGHGNVVVEPQVEFTASQVRGLKDFYSEFFDVPAKATEGKALARETADAFSALQHELAELHAQSAQFPFLNALAPVLLTLKDTAAKNANWFLTELPRQEDALLDLKEQLIDPLRKFMNGPQKAIFEEAIRVIQEQEDNFGYIQGDEAAQIKAALTDPNGYKGSRLQQIKGQLDTLQQKIADQRDSEAHDASATINTLESRLRNMPEYVALSADKQAQLAEPFLVATKSISGQKRIAMIRDLRRRFEEQDYPQLLGQLENYSRPALAKMPEQPAPATGGVKPSPVATPAQPQIIAGRSIKVAFDKAWLADETDLNSYLDALREAWLKEISAGKRVQI
jgi:hypothetical protein